MSASDHTGDLHDGFAAFRIAPDEPLIGVCRSQAEVMVRAALALCVIGNAYEHMGRGPSRFDDIGLVRACAQLAFDWSTTCQGYLNLSDRLADLDSYPAEPGRIVANEAGALVQSWGMRRVVAARDANVSKEALPGDVIQFLGRGPALGVVIAPWATTSKWPHFDPPAVAMVWAPTPPRVIRRAVMAHTPLSLYRWPDTAPAQPAPTRAPDLEAAL